MKISFATFLSIGLLLGSPVELQAWLIGGNLDIYRKSRVVSTTPRPSPLRHVPGTSTPYVPVTPDPYVTMAPDGGRTSQTPKSDCQGAKGAAGLIGPMGHIGATGAKGQKGEPGLVISPNHERVAFTAVSTTPLTSTSHSIRMPFQKTETLLPGTSIDLNSGTFTCSVPGTYVFMFSVSKITTSSPVWVHLEKNGDVVVSGAVDHEGENDHLSGSAVLVLRRGDAVYLTWRVKAEGDIIRHYTSFSGFLLYHE